MRQTGPALAAAALLAGCFYTGGINDRPTAEIVKLDPGPHFIGTEVRFDASKSSDDTRRRVSADWQARLCTAVSPAEGCDQEILRESGRWIGDPITVAITEHRPILVQVEVTDPDGASDLAIATIEVGNRNPEARLQLAGYKSPENSYVLMRPIEVNLVVDDPDGDELDVEWSLVPPTGSKSADRKWEELGEMTYALTPDVAGLWKVVVDMDDGYGGTVQIDEQILVAEDQPPCISITDPPAVPGALYILPRGDGARTFSVLSVGDDLDPFPPLLDDDPVTGEASFSWRIAGPDSGGSFVDIEGVSAPDIVLDPAAYSVGDIIYLRAEVADRVERVLTCDEEDPTCAVVAGSECVQRVTWGVEIR